MDDVPAGPASPRPRRPSLTVVIPVKNGGRDFERRLRRLRDALSVNDELIVVDDASIDGSATLAESHGARVLHNATTLGPAAARNSGALAAQAPLIFFLDADVAVHPETIRRAVARFDSDPGLSALFGSYDDHPEAPGLVSAFRNLLHHYVHQQGEFVDGVRAARTFWTGCGAIRRQVFLDFGGFDPKLYRRPAIEDIELGYRMTRAGCRIVLDRDIQATHLKRWTLSGMVRTDIFQRGVPWMLLLKRSKTRETDLNVRLGQKLSVAAAGLAALSAMSAFLIPASGFVTVAALGLIIALNAGFYRFLASRRGWRFAMASILLHYVYFCSCGMSVVIALGLWHLILRHDEPQSTNIRKDPPESAGGTRTRPWAWRPSRWIRS